MTNTCFRPISSIVTFNKGKPPVQLPYHGPDAAPYLTPEYLRGKGSFEYAKPSPNAPIVDDGDTVVLWDGSNAGEIFLGRAGLLASTMSLVRHSKDFDKSYFFYSLKRWENYLKGQTSGSGIPHVDKEILGKLELYLLPLNEQSKIAHILSSVDRAIEQTEALIAKQQSIKSGLMQDLLTRGIDEEGNLRSEKTHQFKDSPLGRIPIEWRLCPISRFGAKERPWLRSGPFGSNLNTKHWVKDGIPVLTIGSLGEAGLIESELLHIEDSTAKTLDAFTVSPGDLVFSRVADIGRCLVIQHQQNRWIISSNLMRISLDPLYACPEFLHMNIIQNTEMRKQLRIITNSNGRELVNGPILSSLLFSWPDLNEQKRIVDFSKLIIKDRSSLITEFTKLCALKTALMQDLLTGRRRVTALLQEKETANA
jgi:type I restriction enzyme S subunit